MTLDNLEVEVRTTISSNLLGILR